MPLHDWTRVPSGLFHDFRQGWTVRLAEALNSGQLPSEMCALLERSGIAAHNDLAFAPITRRSDEEIYARLANRIVVRHHLERVVAVIEIVSPGDKNSLAALRRFVDKTVQFLRDEIHVLVVDVFPPSPRDPNGIHKAIWNEIADEPFAFQTGKDRVLVSYEAGYDQRAYIETLTIGDVLHDMPLFLASRSYAPVPLESTYMATWNATPDVIRHAVETGELPT